VRFVVVTIFPEFFETPLTAGLLGKGLADGLMFVELVQLRDFTHDRHQKVDDTPFGGGPGMVMMPGPLVDAIEHVKAERPVSRCVLMSPRGRRFTQAVAAELAALDTVVLVCGRYEGVDERVVQGGFVDDEISLGDFVLGGGEAAALVIIEACSRLIPGLVGNEESVTRDAFSGGALGCPQYTKPREFRGMTVPEVLVSGNHAAIDAWRRKRSLELTRDRRPDLFEKIVLTPRERKLLDP
jgi:tRNA (guanine37-N1)-methyltransferase